MVGGDAAPGTGSTDGGSAFAKFFETLTALAAADVHPGERRLYHLVARDLSGNWGDSAVLAVTVPDLEAPPTPWSVRALEDHVGGRVALTWPRVDVTAYRDNYRAARRFCNLGSARVERRLEFVERLQSCDAERPLAVDLAVESYLVYRFADGGRAQRFVDIDGDGFDDAEERGDVTDPGTACDATAPDPASSPLANNLLSVVPVEEALRRPQGHWVHEFSDAEPAADPGRVYWYRVATRDAAGNVSEPSHPVRGFLPDRTAPARESFVPTLTFGRRVCSYQAETGDLPEGRTHLRHRHHRARQGAPGAGALRERARHACRRPVAAAAVRDAR